jgi:hypothetical protein
MPGLTQTPGEPLPVVPTGPGPVIPMPATPTPPVSGAAGTASGLARQFLGGVNPFPFVLALVAMGVVMLAYPKAAVPLGVILVLGALSVDQKALAAFQLYQKGQGQ